MRKLIITIGLLAAITSVLTIGPATAAAQVSVHMTLTEPLKAGWPGGEPCPDVGIDVNCGSGEVVPFGHATHILSIGACGENCGFRQIDLAEGSIFLIETVSDVACPGACVPEWPHGAQFTATLSETVVGGTGAFENATGTLSGTLKAAAWHAQIKLAGTITLAG